MKENYLANVFDTTTVYLKSGVSEIIAVITLLNLNKLILRELSVRMNNIIRTITFSSKYCKMTILYQKLNILKLEDIYGLKLAKYMHQLHNNKLPFSLFEDYVKLNEIHSHNTRQTQNAVYFKPRVNKSIGKELLVYRGANL